MIGLFVTGIIFLNLIVLLYELELRKRKGEYRLLYEKFMRFVENS